MVKKKGYTFFGWNLVAKNDWELCKYEVPAKLYGTLKAVVTQNIDGLHQMAGSKKVLELHGSVYRNYCMKCGKSYDFKYMKATEDMTVTADTIKATATVR